MRFTAICHLCGYKQLVPEEFSRNVDAAKKWAIAWEDRHMTEVNHDKYSVQEGSETST